MFLRMVIALETISKVADVLGFLRSVYKELLLILYHSTSSQAISCPSFQHFVFLRSIISIHTIHKPLANSIYLGELRREKCDFWCKLGTHEPWFEGKVDNELLAPTYPQPIAMRKSALGSREAIRRNDPKPHWKSGRGYVSSWVCHKSSQVDHTRDFINPVCSIKSVQSI